MDADVLQFFDQHPDALPLYEKFEGRVTDEIEDVTVKVQKTQISFYNPHMFACVSFAKVRKAAMRPESYIVITFGLGYRKESPRIDIATEAHPNRWTHHVLVSEQEEIDDELMEWIREAARFSASKSRKRAGNR